MPTEHDYGLIAQRAAEDHLQRCEDALSDQQDAGWSAPDSDSEWPDTAGPYCGCITCIVRETLWIAWPLIERHIAVGKSS